MQPGGATAVALNVTVVSPTASGFLSVRPADATGAPSTSSLNFTAGQVVPNAVTVALPTTGGDDGKIEITYNAFEVVGPTSHVLVDIVGYYQEDALPATGTACTAGGLPGTIINGFDGGGLVTHKCFRSQVTTLAGVGGAPSAVDGTLDVAKFYSPNSVDVDAAGNVYVADTSNHRIRKITPAGVVTTLAGQSTPGNTDDTGSSAQFNFPYGVAVDNAGNVYVADQSNNRIRKITAAGVVTTLAGSTFGHVDNTGTAAKFGAPSGVAVDAAGNVYVADSGNNRIRMITPAGVVTTIAGQKSAGNADGNGTSAQFNNPADVAIDAAGNLYVADFGNERIRKITPSKDVTTLAGSTTGYIDATGVSAQFDAPAGIDVDSLGNLYVGDRGNNRIRKITPAGVVTTIAGSTSGYLDGIGAAAQLNDPAGVAIDAAGTIYFADQGNSRIRKIN